MPRRKKKYWKGTSFSDRKQHERQREQWSRDNRAIEREERRKLLHEPKKLSEYLRHAPAWDVLIHFTVPELHHARVNPRILIEIIHDNLLPCYFPEKMRSTPTHELIQRSKRTTLHALFPFGTPMEVMALMNQSRPQPILFEELVAWSLLNAHIPSEELAQHISTEALHTVLSHHPAYRRNIPPHDLRS